MPNGYKVLKEINPPEKRWGWDSSAEAPRPVEKLAATLMDGASAATMLCRDLKTGRRFVSSEDMYPYLSEKEAFEARIEMSLEITRSLADQIADKKMAFREEMSKRDKFYGELAKLEEA